jgi:hypothetical protein
VRQPAAASKATIRLGISHFKLFFMLKIKWFGELRGNVDSASPKAVAVHDLLDCRAALATTRSRRRGIVVFLLPK